MIGFSKKSLAKKPGEMIAALDIGSAKVCCMIARITASGGIHITGVGQNVSPGVRAGRIIDMDALEQAIGQAVETAENMAGETISSITVNIPALHLRSKMITAETHISAGEVTRNDMRRLLSLAREVEKPGESELIHAVAVDYTIDSTSGLRDPIGMKGRTLGARLHTVAADYNVLQNLRLALTRNHLEVETFCADIYAAALSAMVDDERELGSAVIDIGAGTTGLAIFLDGQLAHVASVPIGGAHVTRDIARGITTPLHHAERLKTLHGSAIQTSHDLSDLIEAPQIGEESEHESEYFSRSVMTSIIQPRMEELLEMVRHRIEESGYEKALGRRVVMTGGGALLSGISDLATLILDKQIRIARPKGISGLAEAMHSPAYTSGCGMLIYTARHLNESAAFVMPMLTSGTMFDRIKQWLKENW